MKGASIDIGQRGEGPGNSGKYTNKQLFEVDLGELKSLRKDEIHLDELKHDSDYQLAANAKLVDDQTSADDAKRYKLVMVGRKVSAEET